MLETPHAFSERMARKRELSGVTQAMLGLIAHEEESGSITGQDAFRFQQAVMAVYLGTSFMLQHQHLNKKLAQKMKSLRRRWRRVSLDD